MSWRPRGMLSSRMKSRGCTLALLYSVYSTLDEIAIQIWVFQQAEHLIYAPPLGNKHKLREKRFSITRFLESYANHFCANAQFPMFSSLFPVQKTVSY